ncbi:MAG: hypothetical protein L0Y44_04540 [Phycisphaerales bacterium]|nr:hypothetical protein [Phycisphaerales bacterium]MCI0674499.1 hypothetical protein [Phycisphaerales bacterium]
MRRLSCNLIGAGGALAIACSAMGQSGVTVAVDQFGVRNSFRPGDITAVRLKLTSNLAEPTPIWVQWEVPNADGDIAEIGRSLTLSASQTALTWLYAELPPNTDLSTIWTVRVFEERDGVRGSELGGARISPMDSGALTVDLAMSMIGVVGDKQMHLTGYSNPMNPVNRPASAHENTRVVSGIRPDELPDRWFGLRHFEAIAWAGDRTPPQDLGLDQAKALREYVQRGGHLIISLPSAGNVWGLGAYGQTQIDDLLPCRSQGVVPRKDDATPLSALIQTLSKYRGVESLIRTGKEPEFSIRVFKDLKGGFNVIDNHFEPLIALPDGRVIAIQRLYGFGRITVIGIDLADGRLDGLGLPQADAFWSRVLGKRADAPTASELNEIEKSKRLESSFGIRENSLGSGPLITGRINMEKRAGRGLLLALVLFAAYWVAAGPGGFALLKHYGWAKHAWVAFAGCAALFTAIAWGSVSLLPKPMEVKHVTFLDHVARPAHDPRASEPQYQRAISYFSIYLPDYGSTRVAIASDEGQRDVLTSWTPPGEAVTHFPNADRYVVDIARSPHSFELPARSTSTQLRADWMGGLDPKWGGMLRVDPADPLRVEVDGAGVDRLRGTLVNELPGMLSDVKVIWVKNNRLTRRSYALDEGREQGWVPVLNQGKWLNNGDMWALTVPQNSGTKLDLATVTAKEKERARLSENVTKMYIQPFENRDPQIGAGANAVSESDRRKYFEMLAMFGHIDPPKYLKHPDTSNFSEAKVVFQRHLGRDLDLSAWFTRPCVIIIGYLENSDCPVPLRVDGDDEPPATADGSLTVVRWIYPLPLDEKIAFSEVFEEEDKETEGQ